MQVLLCLHQFLTSIGVDYLQVQLAISAADFLCSQTVLASKDAPRDRSVMIGR
jgi:hypothetical protein